MSTYSFRFLSSFKYLILFALLVIIAFFAVTNFFKNGVSADISQVMLRESPSKQLQGAYVKIDGIDGEVTRTGAKGWIALNEFTQEVKSPRDVASGQATGRRQYAPVIIRKRIDKASTLLAKAIATNQTIPSMTVELTRESPSKGGGKQEVYMKIELKNVMVSSFQEAGVDDNGEPMEEVSFTFQKITWTDVKSGISASDDWSAPV